MTRVRTSDWHNEWSPEHPVQVTWAGGTDLPAYLTLDAAVARLVSNETDPVEAHRVSEELLDGKVRAGSFGIYRLLDNCSRCGGDHDRIDSREACPLPDCGHPEGAGCGCLDGLDSGPYDSRKYAEAGGAAGVS